MSEQPRSSRARRFAARLMTLDAQPALFAAARAARRWLPGDHRYGDPLSLAGDEPAQQLGRRLAAVSAERPSALREVGLSARRRRWRFRAKGAPKDLTVYVASRQG